MPPLSHGAKQRGQPLAQIEKTRGNGLEKQAARELARPEGFEPPTPWFVARYSIQLSYGRVAAIILPPLKWRCDSVAAQAPMYYTSFRAMR